MITTRTKAASTAAAKPAAGPAQPTARNNTWGGSEPGQVVICVPLADLTSHPSQGKLFADISHAEVERLASSLANDGLQQPVEITPDRTIICGHQRVRAAQQLGWTEIRCWVRHDLAQAGPAAIEARLVDDNLVRRQLGNLAKARCYLWQRELQQHNQHAGRGPRREDQRDVLAKQFGVSGRTLARWARALDTPIEVQEAVDAGKLTMKAAGEVAGLPAVQQQEIASRIRAGEQAKTVVQEMIATRQNAEPITTRVARFVKEQQKSCDLLQARGDEIKRIGTADDVETLRLMYNLLGELLIKDDQARRAFDRKMEAIATRHAERAETEAKEA